jgi:hypothetical protein
MREADEGKAASDVFAEAVIARVAAARMSLGAAAATADSHAVAEALDELEEALSTARESGVAVPPVGKGPADR